MSTDGLKLPFGEAPSGRMVAVGDVERGAACDCVCPSCRRPLIARKGDELRHHFAHAADADCAGAIESMQHKLGKQIIADAKQVWMPAPGFRFHDGWRSLGVQKLFKAERVEVETAIGTIRPDIILRAGARTLAVEILVTHRCPPEKLTAMHELGLDTMEIDMAGLRLDMLAADEIAEAVIRNNPRQWLHNEFITATQQIAQAEWNAKQVAAAAAAEAAAREAREKAEALERTKLMQERERAWHAQYLEACDRRAQYLAARERIAEERRVDAAFAEQQRLKAALAEQRALEALPDRPMDLEIPWKATLWLQAIAALGHEAGQRWYSSPTITSDVSVRDFQGTPSDGELRAFDYELTFAARSSHLARAA